MQADQRQARINLFLATMAFAISFALWGLISGLAPVFRSQLDLTVTQVSLLVAIPVLLGSLARIPAGILTDRYGGRRVFTALLVFGLVPAVALALNHSYPSLLFWGFWIGVAGASFAIGIGFLSPWFPAERQGAALGVYGIGNIGQSVAVFSGPLLAAAVGIAPTFLAFGLLSFAWGVVFAVYARDARPPASRQPLQANLVAVARDSRTWLLSLFYFLTFGGFVALGVSLPALLNDLFDLSFAQAGARAAGFVVLATLSRPVGGYLADRIGGQRLLALVFMGLVAAALLDVAASLGQEALADERRGWAGPPPISLFTVGTLGAAMLLGLGNGAVFKLVPLYFPKQTGTVTGFVGAAGGLGGFFPPIALGVLHDLTGSYAPGFVLLGLFAAGCGVVLWRAAVLRVASER